VWGRRLEELKKELLKCQEEAIRAQVKVEGFEKSVQSIYLHIYRLEERANSLEYKLSELISAVNRLRGRVEEIEEKLKKLEAKVGSSER
jgi:predicted  nucleic acid-binding Zn-ribbon protein